VKHYDVLVMPFAERNIDDAHRWYLERNPAHAAAWLDGVKAAIQGLSTFPEAHPIAAESAGAGRGVRQLLYGGKRNWRIFFTVEGSTVRVLHVRHSRRDDWRP
jgi:plasmid stabilization system protein ParE